MLSVDEVLKAVRAHCLECCGNSKNLVEGCLITDCHLYPYRTVGTAKKAVAVETEQMEGQISMFGEDVKNEHGESNAEKTDKK